MYLLHRLKTQKTCILYQKSLLRSPGAPELEPTSPQTSNIIGLSSLFVMASSAAGVYVSGWGSPVVSCDMRHIPCDMLQLISDDVFYTTSLSIHTSNW